MDQPRKVANPARGQLNRENEYFPVRVRAWQLGLSRNGFGSLVPRQPAHLHNTQANLVLTYGIPPEFRGGVHLFILYRHMSSGQSRVYRVAHLRTDGVHCRESAGIGPVNLKVVPNECCLGQVTMDQLICASLSHTRYWYEVSTLKVPALLYQSDYD